MRKKVSWKNISRHLSDVRWPDGAPEATREAKEPVLPIQEEKAELIYAISQGEGGGNEKPGKRQSPRYKAPLLFFLIFVLGAGFFILSTGYFRENSFSVSGNKLAIEEKKDPASQFWEFLRGGGDFFSGVQGIASHTGTLFEEAGKLEKNILDYLFHQKGEELISSLETIHRSLSEIDASGSALTGAASSLQNNRDGFEFYLPFRSEIHRANLFLGALLQWLKSPDERHMLVFLGNTSEMRPAGGFLGSYAHITITGGSVRDIAVHDINDPDRELEQKIIPPLPLQAIVTRWRAADANWFFDFSDSAEKTLQFIEASDFYAGEERKFDGAIAITPKIIEDILRLTGPLKLEKSKVTLTADNFLIEIQRLVQNGQEKNASYPKAVLQEAAPTLFETIASFDDEKRSALMGLVKQWGEERDVMVYLRDNNLQTFFDSLGISGKVYELPQAFSGDYFALVEANIGGNKTDLYMKHEALLQSQIDLDGLITNHLEITRDHEGNKAKYWWYKSANQSYLQIFTPLQARVKNIKGGIKKTITPPTNYAKGGYVADPLVREIESSTKQVFQYPQLETAIQSGKNVFATWSRVGVGEMVKIIVDYERRLPLPPKDGMRYEFVLEKQAGSEREYHVELHAPLGYRWKENGLPVYEFESTELKGREIIPLTFQKIEE